MQNAITTLRIQNFKSIKDVTMMPRRVNIIIGEPNVGKSNILEAMSLLGGMRYQIDGEGVFMSDFIRYEKLRQIFYDNQVSNTIRVTANTGKAVIVKHRFDNQTGSWYLSKSIEARILEDYKYLDEVEQEEMLLRELPKILEAGTFPFGFWYYSGLNSYGKIAGKRLMGSSSGPGYREHNEEVKPYVFKKGRVDYFDTEDNYWNYLIPPYGGNIKSVFQQSANLRKEAANLFNTTGHKILLRAEENEIEIIKEVNGIVYSHPYSSIADTLQRLIFYLAAIESNDDAVLLFEEPEAHSYPVYVSQLARRIVEARNNQFFVVTHSPYFITEVLEEMLTKDDLKSELAIFVAYYEEYQTKVRQLSDQEVYNIRRDGLDVFYNMARFVPQQGE